MYSFTRSRHLDSSLEEILIGKKVKWWICRVCRDENSLVNKACWSCKQPRNNAKQLDKPIIPGSSHENECPLCMRRDKKILQPSGFCNDCYLKAESDEKSVIKQVS